MAFLTLSSLNHDRVSQNSAADILKKHGLAAPKENGKMTIDLGSLEERKIFALMEDLRSRTNYMLQQLTEEDPNAAEPTDELTGK